MSLISTTTPNSFVQVTTPDSYGACSIPTVSLPMITPNDLCFQLTFLASGSDLNYLMQFFNPGVSYAGMSGPDVMGSWGAVAVKQSDDAPVNPSMGEIQWVLTACSLTGNSLLGVDEYVLYFQPNPAQTSWEQINQGDCFNLAFYYLQYIHTALDNPYNVLATAQQIQTATIVVGHLPQPVYLYSFTTFLKIYDGADSYPTSLLEYANNTDALGFYYDPLYELVDNINYLNRVRLPFYLHSLAAAEEETSYEKSDGSTQLLAYRMWLDYKLITDNLTPEMYVAFVAATGHSYLFITCPYAGLDPWADGSYQMGISTTQFVRKEKLTAGWKQTDPGQQHWKLAKAEGTLRLALPAAYVNSNCSPL